MPGKSPVPLGAGPEDGAEPTQAQHVLELQLDPPAIQQDGGHFTLLL